MFHFIFPSFYALKEITNHTFKGMFSDFYKLLDGRPIIRKKVKP